MRFYLLKEIPEIKCPECGHTFRPLNLIEPRWSNGTNLITCNIEDGGCDMEFVVDLKHTVHVEATSYRLVQMGDDE